MSVFSSIKSFFQGREQPKLEQRGYREVSGIGSTNSDWNVNSVSEDSDVWTNSYLLTSRMRDLARTNPTFQKYRDLLWANIFGSGIMLSMQITETEDRVIYAPDNAQPAKKQRIRDEKWALIQHERDINRLREWAAKRNGREPEQYNAFKLADALETRDTEIVMRGAAMVSIGAPDVYANLVVQKAWTEWQRPEFCDARGNRSYNTIRQLRLWSAVRDGGFFIRIVSAKSANKFGTTLQLINDEWCDRFLNTTLPNGNVVRMGIEYQFTPWGIGKPVAYYFIKRQPMDWQFSIPGAFNMTPGPIHERISADEIIHYVRNVDADGTRPAPWAASVIPKARQLDQYELAEVVTAREQACANGYFYSDVLPEGGLAQHLPDPTTGVSLEKMGPGDKRALKWGVKYQQDQPTHPNGNAQNFRKMMMRSQSAGMPGADYSRLANDYEAINFSAGRLQMLDTTGIYEIIQQNDIDVAENPIFERWLENSLIFGAIALPFAKYDKFNRKVFQGERWPGVDEVKEATASALRVANHQSTNGIECARRGLNFADVLTDLAREKMMAEELGIDISKTVQSGAPPVVDAEDEEDPPATAAAGSDAKPAAKKTNGKKTKLANGSRFAIAE